jgi:hypothetical protein
MKKEVLIALIDKWNRVSAEPQTSDGAPEAQLLNAVDKGKRAGQKQCADDLLKLISLLD